MRTILAAAVAAAFLTIGGAMVAVSTIGPSNAGATTPRIHHHPWDQSHQPCAAEDEPGPCFWNADSRGNQKGIDVHFDRKGRHYVPFRDVDGHDACWIHVAGTSRIACESKPGVPWYYTTS